MLWAKAGEIKAPHLGALLTKLKDDVSVDFEWTDSNAYAGVTKRAQMKDALKAIFENDKTFTASTRHVIDTDAEFADARARLRAGSCTSEKRCAVATVTPKTYLVDGTGPDVTFAVHEDGRDVVYTRGGVTRAVQALPCDTNNQNACDHAFDVGPDGTLRAGSISQIPPLNFLVHGTDTNYLVPNSLSSRDPDMCTTRYCEKHNGASCPSHLCARDKERCVPRTPST